MTKRLKALTGSALSMILLLAALPAAAQFNASLSGTVLDPTQAAIPGASVTLTNESTQAKQTAVSSGEGVFRFTELAPGSYTISVTATGFQQNLVSHVTVAAETPRNVDVTLTTGQETQTVNVNGDTVPLLQTSDANIGTTIDSTEIQRLPIFGADPYELLRTAPGITGTGARSGSGSAVFLPNGAGPGGSNSGIFQTENQVQISADGQRVADNNYNIDGVSVNSLTHGGAAVVTPNEEAVGSINILSTSYDASDGRNTGAQIKVVTKSGTNQLHGSLFFLYDQPGLNAFNKYGGPTPGTLPVRVENQQRTWAASIGGPIIKDKLFFFGSFQEFKLSQNTSSTAYVETPAFRSAVEANRPGSVTAAILADPNVLPRIQAVLTPSCTGFNAGTCAVVSGGIDIGSLTPGGASQIGFFPVASTGGGLDGVADLENVQLFVPAHSRGNQYNARIDYQATPKDLVAGSLYFTKLDSLGTSGTAGSRPQADVPFKPLNSAGTLIYVHTFSPAWLNELRGNVTRFTENGVKDAGNAVNFGIPFANVQGYPVAIQYGINYGTSTPATFAENTYEIRDTVTHTFGSHTLLLGIEARAEQDNDNLNGEQRPLFAFGNLFAFANSAAVYEMITANPATGGTPLTQRYFRSEDIAAFIQHDWKATRNLTFNAGLRWEFFTPLRNKGFAINYPVLGPAGNELGGTTLVARNHLWDAQPRNFGPRVGFAYTPPLFNNKLVVRGGYALSYNHLDISLFNPALEDGPGVASFGLCCASNTGSAGVLYALGTSNSPSSFPVNPATAVGVNASGFPANGAQVEVYGADPHLKYPSSDLYSLDIQRELGQNMILTVGYAGASGRHYARLVDQNFLYSQLNSPVYAFYRAQTDSVANYNSLNITLRRPTRHNISYSVAYTYAKNLDQISNGDGANSNANQTNPADNASEYGPSDNDIRHHITATGLYQTPTFHTGNRLLDAAVNGFQINGTYTFYTGFPWTPVTGSLNSNPFTTGAASINPVRPLGLTGTPFGTSCSSSAFTTGSNFPDRSGAGGGSNYFLTTLPTGNTYTPGIGRNSFHGPCYQDVDMSFAKEVNYDFGEHHTLIRFQANMYNIFNILQLQPLTNGNSNGGSNIDNTYFGYSQGADAGRVIEFLARFQF